MDTTEAATAAGVTRQTIRHWARTGAIAAAKHAGRWTICETSLNQRIKIGTKMTTPKHLCGHPIPENHVNPRHAPKSRCKTCKAARGQKSRKATEETISALVLPRLTGSEKQIAWAQRERDRWINEAIRAEVKRNDETPTVQIVHGAPLRSYNTPEEAAADINAMLAEHTEAAWWINHRGGLSLAITNTPE